MILCALISLLGCRLGYPSGHAHDSEPTYDTGHDTDTEPYSNPTSASLDWHANRLEVTVEGGAGEYDFGIVESGLCGDVCWTAEDCIGGSIYGYGPFCHSATGDDTASIGCISDPADASDDKSLFCNVVANKGETTLTYYLGAPDDSWCAVFGVDTDYYAAMGCEVWE